MILIFTNSFDATTDLILHYLNSKIPVFRFNLDLLEKYKITVRCGRWEIRDIQNRCISSRNCARAIWRKPFTQEIKISSTSNKLLQAYSKAENLYVINYIVEELARKKKFIFSYPYAEKKLTKLLQLKKAQEVFAVPNYEFVFNQRPKNLIKGSLVTKSLSGHEIAVDDVVYTTIIDPEKLDYRFPWFLQKYIKKKYDITVFYMYGRVWCIQHKCYDKGSVVDWRKKINSRWSEKKLPAEFRGKIRKYMELCKLKYGRLDFCQDEKNKVWFLEVNPNGQFAWLDIWLNKKGAVIKAVCEEIGNNYPLQLA
jgi:hypothetical protein